MKSLPIPFRQTHDAAALSTPASADPTGGCSLPGKGAGGRQPQERLLLAEDGAEGRQSRLSVPTVPRHRRLEAPEGHSVRKGRGHEAQVRLAGRYRCSQAGSHPGWRGSARATSLLSFPVQKWLSLNGLGQALRRKPARVDVSLSQRGTARSPRSEPHGIASRFR